MVKFNETKQPAARKKILVAVCEEFKEKFGDELDTPVRTKGKTEKQLLSLLKQLGLNVEVDDNISKESEGLMVELGFLSEEYTKALAKGGKSKSKKAKEEPDPEKKGKKGKKVKEELEEDVKKKFKKVKEEPEPEPEKKLSKKEKKAAKKAAEAAATKKKKSFSRVDAICQVVNDDDSEVENLDQLAELGDDLYAENGGTSNLNESKAVTRMISKVLVHFDIDVPTK